MISLLEAKLRQVLGLRDAAALDPELELSHYGVNSINAAKFSHALSRAFGQEISPRAIIEHFSLAALARHLVNDRGIDLSGAAAAVPAQAAARPDPSTGPNKAELVEKILLALKRRARPGATAEVRAEPRPAPAAGAAPSAPAPHPSRTLDFSFLFFSSQRRPVSANLYEYVTAIAHHADANGFAAIWVPERHFFEFGGIFPDPAVLLANLAATTSSIRLRSGSVVLPLHHATRVVESWSMLDNLSAGRVDMAFASGWNPNDFVSSPGTYPTLRETWFERMSQVERLWRGEHVAFYNGKQELTPIKVYPRPVQPRLAIWMAISGNPESFVEAGRRGYNILTMLASRPVEELAGNIARYRQARADQGFDPGAGVVTLMLHTYVHEDPSRVDACVHEHYYEYIKSGLAGHVQAMTPKPSEDEVRRIVEHSFHYQRKHSALFGDVAHCRTVVDKMRQIGVNEIACLVDFGLSEAEMYETLPYITQLKDAANGITTAPVASPPAPRPAPLLVSGAAPARAEYAIVGMAGTYPGAPSLEGFWDNLIAGRNCVREVGPDRYDWRATWGDPRTEPGKTNIRHFGLIDDIYRFDASFFRISKREAELMDPHARLLLQTVWQCIENAGYAPPSLSTRRTGLFLSFYNPEYLYLLDAAEIEKSSEPYLGTALSGAIKANRISHLLGLTGPSEVYDTACSSALVALHRAMQSIAAGDCAQALVAGVSLLLTPRRVIALSKLGILNTTGVCNPFSYPPNKEVIGEGVGALLIKPLADALAARDYIYAVVSGSDVSHQGNSSGSLTMPSAGALAELMDTTYRKLGLGPEQVSYIEGHGSGNDSDLVELLAFQQRFAAVRDRHTVWVGSVKSNIGFGEGSGGMAQLTKCALALDRGVVPATLHFEQADPSIDLPASGLAIPTTNRELPPRGGAHHYMSVLAYGLGGAHGHVVLRDHVTTLRRDHVAIAGAPYPMLFSAGSEAGLSAYLGDVHRYLRQDRVRRNAERWCGSPDAVLDAISRTLMARERHGAHRVALLVSSYDELLSALAGAPRAGSITGPVTAPPEVARWVEGAAWSGGQGESPYQRLALPPPPFAGEPLRLKPKASSDRPQPDLAQRMQWSRTEAGAVVSVEIFADDYFVCEHVVDGTPIVPAAAYLALLSRIARSVFGLARCVIKNIAWLRPLAVPGPASARLQFAFDAEGQFRALDPARGTVYCKGQLWLDAEPARMDASPRLATTALDAEAALLDAEAYWELLNGPQSKQRHGAAFRCVDGLYRQGTACVARLRGAAPSQLLPEIPWYDAALGASIGAALMHGAPPAPAVPFSIEAFTVVAALPEAGPVYAVASLREGKLPRYDISLEDGAGRVHAVLSGFYAKPFEALPLAAPGADDASRPPARPAAPAAAPGPSGSRSRDALLAIFRSAVAAFLKLRVEDVPTDDGLEALGLDSIAVNAVTQQLSQQLAIDLPATLMFEYTRIEDMVAHVLELSPSLGAAELGVASAAPPSRPSPAGVRDAAAPRRAPAVEAGIAVVGIGGVFPGAANVHDFWAKLKAGRDLIVEMPAARRAVVDRLFPDRAPGLGRLFGGFVDDAERFDAEFFGFSDEEVMAMDPQQRLFLIAAWQAIEDAGDSPRSLSGRNVGVYAGAIASEYAHLLSAARTTSPFIATGNALSGVANRVSYVLDLNGPSQTIDVACASSLYAIDRAVQDLRAGVCEAALVGGVSFIATPYGFQSYAAMNYLAKDWRCKTFAAGGDGWSKGELFAAVYLKPLPQALADHDAIYAVIAASGTNHGGKSHFYEQPSSAKHLELITRVYREAGLDPRDLVHIEAHGTGTEMGDALEYNVFARALYTVAKERGVRVEAGSCAVGSIKSNMGHAEAASGIAGFIKSVLLLHDKVIPPSLHLQTPNKHLRLNGSPLQLASAAATFAERAHHGAARHAGVHSFNFSGAAAHVVLREAPAMAVQPGSLGLTRYPVCVSAPSLEGLAACVTELSAYLDSGVPASLDAVVYTLNRSRSHFAHRLAWTAATLDELRGQLVTAARALAQGAPVRGELGDGIRYGQVDPKSAQKVRDYAALSDATVPALLAHWLGASRFDWSVVLAPFAVAKQHLPVGSFRRERSYFPQVAAPADVAAPAAVAAVPVAVSAAAVSPVPARARAVPEAATGDLASGVQAVLGELFAVAPHEVELHGSLAAFAFDSLKFTQLAATLNDRYALSTTAADYFMWASPAEIVAFLGEQLARSPVALRAAHVAGAAAAAPPVAAPSVVAPSVVAPSAAASPEPIAIIGVSGAFPGAPDVQSFWQVLATGRDCIREIPKDRWDWRALYGDPRRDGDRTDIKWGGFLDGVAEFDPQFFQISPHEAELMDPQQRLLMMHTWKAIEDAGYSPEALSGTRTGIFAGTTSSGYGEMLVHANQSIDAYSSTGAVASLGPNRMSYLLNLHGPSEPIETACSSSLVAIHRAVRAMQSGDCELALVGGINTIVSPWGHIGFSRAGMLCEDGRCKTFSKHANGYVRGEGVGMLLLKALSAAERDGDHIYAVIRGSAENHGGRASSLTAPNPRAQAEVIKAAYRGASVDPRSVSYIEAHGTGTALGDPIEINGLKKAFADLTGDAQGADAQRADGQSGGAYCGIGSVKTNVGHLEMAAGIAGVIKVLLQLEHRTLVASLHCDELNPDIQLDGSPFYIVREAQPWNAQRDRAGRSLPRRAGVSSFGFGGVNAHVVLEEYCPPDAPRPPDAAVTPAHPALIVLSARTEDRLQDQARQLLAWLAAPGRADHALIDIAYTLQVGRAAMEHRLAFTAVTLDEARDKLARPDRCYRGEVKRYREVMSIFHGDGVLQAALPAWVRDGKHAKLLELWVKGVAFDWERLYGPDSAYGARRPRRIALPTYPFARERYWAHGHDQRGEAQPARAARALDGAAGGAGEGPHRGLDAGAFEALLDDLAGQRISVEAALDRVSAPTVD